MKKLSLLRWIFIVYMIIKMIIDIAGGVRVTGGATGYLHLSPHMYYPLVISIDIILILLGLLLFYYLMGKKNWARILLLVIGWLVIIDFFTSLLFSQKSLEVLNHIDPSTNWHALIVIDLITDVIGLIFWGYVIYILQFNTNVKRIFLQEAEEKPAE